MAREYARYLNSTHRDEDWRKLSTAHHDAYMALLSSSGLTWAGVVPFTPAAYAELACDLTEKKVTRIWADLESAGMLVIDRTSCEVLVRTFLRHDNVLAKPNLTKAFVAALRQVRSPLIRSAILGELQWLLCARPDLAGWRQVKELFPKQFPELFAELFPEPLPGTVPGTIPGTDAEPSFKLSNSPTNPNRHLANARVGDDLGLVASR